MTLPGAQESLILRSLAPAYCASFTLSAKATVFRVRARSSLIVCSLSSCLGGVCPESQAAAALTVFAHFAGCFVRTWPLTFPHRIRRGSRLLTRFPGRPANLGRHAFRYQLERQIGNPFFYSIQRSF